MSVPNPYDNDQVLREHAAKLERSLDLSLWPQSELRSIGITYCGVDVANQQEVEDGLTEGLIYAFLEGVFDRQHEVWEKQFNRQAANARLWRNCCALACVIIVALLLGVALRS